jgi:hypothetical protein
MLLNDLLSIVQRLVNRRCIVSSNVVYAKNADTHLGIRIFAILRRKGLENSNATVRWTVARFRLDGIDTFIFSRTAGENANESLPVYILYADEAL